MDNAYIPPAELAEMTGDFAAIGQTPFGRKCRMRDEIKAVQDRKWREWGRIMTECHEEIERIKRRYGL